MYRVSGFQFFNTSRYTLAELVNDSDHLAANFRSYLQGFSPNVLEILMSAEKGLDFGKQIDKMDKNNRLLSVVKAFSELDLDPRTIDNVKIFCLSILVGFGGYYLLPSGFVDKMPFSSRDWNVIACIVLLSIVAYLLFSLVRYLFSKISTGRIRSKNRKYYARQDRAAEEENIEKYKSDIDRLSDRDYSILMYLLENENKKPFIQWGRMYGESILDSEEVFDSAPYQGTPPVIKDPISGVNPIPVADNPRQYPPET